MAVLREGSSTVFFPKSIVLFMALAFLYETSSATSVFNHLLSKRSFFDLNCRGVYDKSIYARVDRVCLDCYNLYREPELHTLCRSDCYRTGFFKGCLNALLLENDEYHKMVMILGRK